MKRTLIKVVIGRKYLNIIKVTYDKLTANIILNGEMLKAFPLKSGTRQGCPLSLFLLNIVLEDHIVFQSSQTGKEIKGIYVTRIFKVQSKWDM